MRVVFGLATALLVAVGACQKPETPEQAQARMQRETAAAKTEMDAVARNWERWAAAGQADSIASVFTEQGAELPPNAPQVNGRDAIKAYETQLLGMGQWTIQIGTDEELVNGPLGVSRGPYTLELKPASGAAVADTGKYLIHWHRVGGKWLIADLAWNSNIPLPPPPAAKSKPTRGK